MADEHVYTPPTDGEQAYGQAATPSAEGDTSSQLLETKYEGSVPPLNTEGVLLTGSDAGDLLLAPSGDAVNKFEGCDAKNDRGASDDEKSSVTSPETMSLLHDEGFGASTPNSPDTASEGVDELTACSDPSENDDGTIPVTSSTANAPIQSTNLEPAGPTDCYSSIDSFGYWDASSERTKMNGGSLSDTAPSSAQIQDTRVISSAHAGLGAVIEDAHNWFKFRLPIDYDDSDNSMTSSTDISENQDFDREPLVSPSSDSVIGSLVSRMETSLVIKDAAVQVPSMITVPKGCVMTDITTPEQHHKAHHLTTIHVKRKRDEGVLAQPSRYSLKNEQYGFRAAEINSSGAIFTHNCQMSNLSNEIHPLLSRNRFDDTPDAIYDQLVPSLRLASLFLTQSVAMQYWVTMALGERRYDEEMSMKYGSYCQRIDHHVQLTEKNIAEVAVILDDLANANLVHFAFRHKNALPISNVWACSHLISEHRTGGKAGLTRSIIRLHADHYTVAEKLSRLKYLESSQVLRFSFHFAVLLLHELAHSVDLAYLKHRSHAEHELHVTQRYVEPFFMGSKSPPECGRLLEVTMFGGEIQPINKRVDGSHGLCTSDWPPRSVTFDSKQRLWYTVPMDYIQSLFLTETWNSKGHLRNYKTFHIPRIGATASYMTSFTTMEWAESEEAAEASTLAKEQPAFKKRLIATGKGEDKRLEEDDVVSFFFGRVEAIRMEETSRRFLESSHSRRRSIHATDAEEDYQPPTKKLRRSRSTTTSQSNSVLSQEKRDAITNDLRDSFRIFQEKAPTPDTPKTPVEKVSTSELVKGFRKRSTRTAQRRIASVPPQSPTMQSPRGR